MLQGCFFCVSYMSVRTSTTLLLTSLVLLWALQPLQRYSPPCWPFSRTTQPLDLRPAQQRSTSNRKPSSGSSPRTQNRRQPADVSIVVTLKEEEGKPDWKPSWFYCTCIGGRFLLLSPVNDQTSLEKLQETGGLFPLRHNHLQKHRNGS